MNPRTISATWLREPRLNGVIPLGVDCALMLADAIEIADSAARSDIETNCECHPDRPEYDLSSVDPDDGWALLAVPQAARYLEARGLIERGEGGLVRLLDAAKV